LPRESDDVEGHRQGIDPKQGEDFLKVPLPRESDDVEDHRQG
jgi:hypothetical protein